MRSIKKRWKTKFQPPVCVPLRAKNGSCLLVCPVCLVTFLFPGSRIGQSNERSQKHIINKLLFINFHEACYDWRVGHHHHDPGHCVVGFLSPFGRGLPSALTFSGCGRGQRHDTTFPQFLASPKRVPEGLTNIAGTPEPRDKQARTTIGHAARQSSVPR